MPQSQCVIRPRYRGYRDIGDSTPQGQFCYSNKSGCKVKRVAAQRPLSHMKQVSLEWRPQGTLYAELVGGWKGRRVIVKQARAP